jgi:GMP synthase (glutamine-hydrolysing)
MFDRVRYLLLQSRNAADPMRPQEVRCFTRALRCEVSRIATFDLIGGSPSRALIDAADVILLGGSGDYSVVGETPWLTPAFQTLRELHRLGKPTFASCWGCQAFARALGGEVIHDDARAEVGTHEVQLTAAGKADPIFAPLGNTFLAQMGHADRVARLPADAILLASTALVETQAYRFAGRPIYCTQFHPELNRAALFERLEAYPSYIQRVSGLSVEEFKRRCCDTPASEAMLRRFVETVLA